MTTPNQDVPDLLDRASLQRLREALEESPVIVELRFPGSPHPPERMVFNDYAMLIDYLGLVARSGDVISVWRFDEACRPDNVLARSRQVPGGEDG
jgi:hypothetical protein